jgi:putative membrane protein
METESSLNHSIHDAKKHYSSMFFLPTFKKAIVAVAVLSFVIGLSAFAVSPSQGVVSALVLGVSLFVLTLFADLSISKVLMKGDQIFVLRRTLVLSLVGLVFWLIFILIGVGLSFPFGWLLWVELCLLGYAAVITLRTIVLIATSMAPVWRKGLSVLLQPTLCIIAFLVFWTAISKAIPMQVLPFIVVSPVICLVAVLMFFSSIQRLGKKMSLSSIPLFRAFIVNWVTDLNGPFEKLLEDMGQDADVEVSLLKFDSSKPKAAIIVPLVHPGPFKNIGSSLLPSLLKRGFEQEYGCDTCTPLGILGHELDLASQKQNHKIVSQVVTSAKFRSTADFACSFVKTTEGPATASCQIFGDTALLSFTLAPKTTEDLPQELGRIVSEEAKKYGLKHVIVINTHNSINDIIDTEEYVGELQTAAFGCLQKAVTQPTKPFMVGGASVFPKEFSLKAGMGPGGITAIVVQVETQKTAYVIIDGNNMISGLREKILAALASMGFEESEVFTTDTHAVSAIVTGQRGYHPVGEVMDQEVLIHYICEVSKKAESNLENSTAGFLHLVVPQVRVIGEARLKSVTTLVDKAIQKAKQMLVPVFGLEGLLLVLLLIILLR